MIFSQRLLMIARQVLVLFIICANGYLFFINYHSSAQQFSWQAQSFLEGKLEVYAPKDTDMVVVDDKIYWPQGPFPSIILAVFQVLIGPSVQQGLVQMVLVVFLTYMLYKLARLRHFSWEQSMYLVCAFLFGSIVIGIITNPTSWFFAQVVALVLLVLLLYEWESRRNYLIMGLLEASLIATRMTAGFFGFYIVYALIMDIRVGKRTLIQLLQFIIPIIISLGLLSWFNWARFGNFFDTGYFTNNIGPEGEALRQFGLFSLRHIFTNIYWYFLSSVEGVTNGTAHLVFPYIRYNLWGLSFFIVSPIFLYTISTLRNNSTYLRGLWCIAGLTLTVLLLYYTTGWYTFGPRYMADLLPILYILLLYVLKKQGLGEFQKNLIVASAFFNTYLLLTARI